jgi:hypothetical protein
MGGGGGAPNGTGAAPVGGANVNGAAKDASASEGRRINVLATGSVDQTIKVRVALCPSSS